MNTDQQIGQLIAQVNALSREVVTLTTEVKALRIAQAERTGAEKMLLWMVGIVSGVVGAVATAAASVFLKT